MPLESPKRPPARPDGLPRISPGGDQPERGAVRMPRAEPPKRTVTLPGIPSLGVPPLPGELAPTLPVPRSPLRETIRRPTPPSAVAAARRTPVPARHESGPTESASQGQPDSLAAELSAARAKLAEYERRERVQVESKGPGPYQRPIERSQSPVPSSGPVSRAPSSGDWAKLRYKVATAVVGALVLVIGALAYWGAAAINAKTEALQAAREAKQKAESRDAQWRQWASVVIWIADCRNGQQLDVNEMILPAPDKMGSARKPEPWIVKCPKALPPPP